MVAKICVTATTLWIVLVVQLADAQQPEKIHRIGYVRAEKPPEIDIESFRLGLRDHGYVEGKNIIVEYRWADGSEEKLRELVHELIRLKVDLIVTSAPAATQAAKEATTKIPLVMVTVADPVAFGFVSSLARPGGNITGFAYLLPELSGKRLELLKEAFPKLSRVLVLWNATNPYKEADLKEVLPVAHQLKMEVQKGPVRGPNDFDDMFVTASKGRPGGLITLEDPFTIAHRKKIVDLARRYRLPALYAVSPFVEVGGLMSYGPDRGDHNRRAAKYVDRILKGTKPAELPVERPTKFEFIVNLKAAKEIGVTIAPNVLVRADRVIR